jgi:hypothetical protein
MKKGREMKVIINARNLYHLLRKRGTGRIAYNRMRVVRKMRRKG